MAILIGICDFIEKITESKVEGAIRNIESRKRG
jgi:hypothetical protein